MNRGRSRVKMDVMGFLMQRRVLAWIAIIEAGLLVAQVSYETHTHTQRFMSTEFLVNMIIAGTLYCIDFTS